MNETSRLRPAVVAAAVVVAAYTAAAGIAAIVTGNGEFAFYVAVMVVLTAGIAGAHWRINFSTALLWLLVIWGALHMAGGLVPVPASWPIDGEIRVLYSWWIIPRGAGGGYLKYDQVVHAFGFGVTTWACWQGLMAAVGRRLPTFGLVLLCAVAGLGFGALNEVVEFAATLMGPTNVGGYFNTGLDLVANTVGAAVAAIAIYTLDRAPATA
jgi:hypothetical protein